MRIDDVNAVMPRCLSVSIFDPDGFIDVTCFPLLYYYGTAVFGYNIRFAVFGSFFVSGQTVVDLVHVPPVLSMGCTGRVAD